VDYRGSNKVTVKDRTPLPLMSRSELRERLGRAKIYNLIRIAEGDEWKTAFRMRYGVLEHLGCHHSSEGIAMSPAKIQSIENWAELRISPAKIQSIENWAELRISPAKTQPIEDWAEPRSVENVQQFSSFANLYREVAGKDSANRELG
jgi:hypothetical protein